MCLDIIDGISVKLNEYFGDEYKIYAETVEQGLSLPCFFIDHEETINSRMLGERYLVKYSFDINYFPKNDKSEMLLTAEKLGDCLKLVELPNSDFIRGKEMRYKIKNGVLHFYVAFNLILTMSETPDLMGSFDYKLL